jgi:hypothetical protein
MNPLHTLRRLIQHSEAIVQGLADQSDMLNRSRLLNEQLVVLLSEKLEQFGANLKLIGEKMDTLTELQMAQLCTQRDQAEAIDKLAAAILVMPKSEKRILKSEDLTRASDSKPTSDTSEAVPTAQRQADTQSR